MKDYIIVDNFLDNIQYKTILDRTIQRRDFPLYLVHGVANYGNDSDGVYFTHNFYSKGKVQSDLIYLLDPILQKINFSQLIRVQLNIFPKTNKVKKHNWHIDYDYPHKGAIYYLNTNNGYTILQKNFFDIKVKSIGNRCLFFDPSKKHRSTSCSDFHYRSNIIINYI